MEWNVLIMQAVVIALAFTVLVFVGSSGDRKHSPAGIHNYPPEIQEEYFKTHKRVDVSYRSKNVVLAKGTGLVMFTAFFASCALAAGAKTFWQGFAVAFGLMAWIGVYDTCFIDWVLFANMKMFRLEGTEHMDKAYRQKWFHAKGMLFPGALFGVIVGTLSGLLVMLFR